jgi:hypothetical protein
VLRGIKAVAFLVAGSSVMLGKTVILEAFHAPPCATPGGAPYNSCDVIGDRFDFDIEKIEASFGNGSHFEISLNFGNPYNSSNPTATLKPFNRFGLTLAAGDLFFGSGTDYEVGVPLYSHDCFQAGQSYLIDGVDIYTRSAQSVLGNPNAYYRNNRDVYLGGGGTAFGAGLLQVFQNGNGITSGEFKITLDFDAPTTSRIIGYAGEGSDLGIHLAYTCGNDTLDGMAQTPEPATLLLLPAGFLGLGLLRKRRA